MQAESAASRANTRVSLHLHLTGLATARERRAGVCMQPRWWLVEPALPVHAAAAALLALVLPAVVRAEDPPMAVPAHCTAAVGIAAAAAAAIITSAATASAAAAVDVAPRTPRQPVDQLLLLPALRQSRLRAELLQIRDGHGRRVPHEASQPQGQG